MLATKHMWETMKHFWNTTSRPTFYQIQMPSPPLLPPITAHSNYVNIVCCTATLANSEIILVQTRSHKVPCAAATGRARKIPVTLKVAFVLRCHYSINRACFIISHHIPQFPIYYYQQRILINERERMPANHLRNLLTHPLKGRKVRAPVVVA